MKARKWLLISLIFNVIFLIGFSMLAYKYKDRIYRKMGWDMENQKIIMFGDSITELGDWTDLLGRKDILNRGFSGLCTHHLTELVKPMVTDLQPQICFVMAGINDVTVGVMPEKMQANFQKILEDLTKNNIKPVVTLTLYEQNDPESMKQVDQLNVFLRKYCSEHQIDYLDINPLLSDSTGLKPEYAVDKTHLNETAYVVWAGEIQKYLKNKGL